MRWLIVVLLMVLAACGGSGGNATHAGGSGATGENAFVTWYLQSGPNPGQFSAQDARDVAAQKCTQFDQAKVGDSYNFTGSPLLTGWDNSRGAADVIAHAVDDVCKKHASGLAQLRRLGTNWDVTCATTPRPGDCL